MSCSIALLIIRRRHRSLESQDFVPFRRSSVHSCRQGALFFDPLTTITCVRPAYPPSIIRFPGRTVMGNLCDICRIRITPAFCIGVPKLGLAIPRFVHTRDVVNGDNHVIFAPVEDCSIFVIETLSSLDVNEVRIHSPKFIGVTHPGFRRLVIRPSFIPGKGSLIRHAQSELMPRMVALKKGPFPRCTVRKSNLPLIIQMKNIPSGLGNLPV